MEYRLTYAYWHLLLSFQPIYSNLHEVDEQVGCVGLVDYRGLMWCWASHDVVLLELPLYGLESIENQLRFHFLQSTFCNCFE